MIFEVSCFWSQRFDMFLHLVSLDCPGFPLQKTNLSSILLVDIHLQIYKMNPGIGLELCRHKASPKQGLESLCQFSSFAERFIKVYRSSSVLPAAFKMLSYLERPRAASPSSSSRSSGSSGSSSGSSGEMQEVKSKQCECHGLLAKHSRLVQSSVS